MEKCHQSRTFPIHTHLSGVSLITLNMQRDGRGQKRQIPNLRKKTLLWKNEAYDGQRKEVNRQIGHGP